MKAPRKKPPQAVARRRKVGRRLAVESPEEMDRLVEEYVTKCLDEKAPVTLTGMILHLGLSSRQSLDRYGERPEFCDSVKRTKTLVERVYEERLHGTTPTGAIFALKNLGWSDQQTINVRGTLASIDYSRLTDDQLARIVGGEDPRAVLASDFAKYQLAVPARLLPA